MVLINPVSYLASRIFDFDLIELTKLTPEKCTPTVLPINRAVKDINFIHEYSKTLFKHKL
jgi:hypothetical protein